eukprot:jgi/Mesen1/6583/ME000336S05803
MDSAYTQMLRLPSERQSAGGAEDFLVNFCRPRVDGVWKYTNSLGAYLPCFIDVVFLGLAYTVMAILSILRMKYLTYDSRRPETQPLEYAACVAAIICVLGPLGQLLAQFYVDAVGGDLLPPYEIFSRSLAVIAWTLAALTLTKETKSNARRGWWYMRFSVLFVIAGQLARLRHTLIMLESYQGTLYQISYTCFVIEALGHILLGELAIFFYPTSSKSNQQEDAAEAQDQEERANSYEPLQRGDNFVCPEYGSGFAARATFRWVWPIVQQGAKRPLHDSDLWQLDPKDCSEHCAALLHQALEKERLHPHPSLLRALNHAYGRRFWLAGFYQLVTCFTQFVGPLMLSTLLGSMAAGNPVRVSFGYATVILVGTLIGSMCSVHHTYNVQRVGLRMRSGLMALLMRKGLYLNHKGRQGFSAARIVGMISGDTGMLQFVIESLHSVWSGPLTLLVGTALLYRLLGTAAIFAGIIYLIAIPIQIKVASVVPEKMGAGMACSGRRVGLLTEMLSYMESVKCFGWEGSFKKQLHKIRGEELGWAKKSLLANTASLFALEIGPTTVTVGLFSFHLLLGGTFSSPVLFAAIAYLAALRVPLSMYPETILNVMGAYMSVLNLQELLFAEETVVEPVIPQEEGKPSVECYNASFSWDPRSSRPTLSDITLSIPIGSLVAVVGATGQGKSSLISALLGEIPAAAGGGDSAPPIVRGRVAYVAQDTWLFHSTIRENVLFGLPFDKNQYEKALRVSSMEDDLAKLPAGDLTVVLERGANLSGGQKQRVTIARAVYTDADVYMFDDPFSALHPELTKQIFHTCINTALAGKTRILVTNQLQHLRFTNHIVMLEGGRIFGQGTFQELMSRDSHFKALMDSAGAADAESPGLKDAALEAKRHAIKERATKNWRKWMRVYYVMQQEDNKQGQEEADAQEAGAQEAAEEDRRRALVGDEERSSGQINVAVLKRYISAMGGTAALVVCLATYVLGEVVRVGGSLWIEGWPNGARSSEYYISGFVVYEIAHALCYLTTVLWLVLISLRASKRLHEGMLDSVLGAPLAFFHDSPLSRLINRFSKDVAAVDKMLASILCVFLSSAFMVLTTFLFVGYLNPLSLPVLAPLLLLFFAMYVHFQRTSRETERLEAATWTPVHAQWSEALGGLHTLRTYRAHARMLAINGRGVDRNARYTFLNMAIRSWLQLRLDLVGAFMIWGIAILIIMDTAGDQASKAPQLGLVLIYAFQITAVSPLVLRMASLAENTFTAVERIVEYIDLPQEVASAARPARPPRGWPFEGRIEFDHVAVRYKPASPLVLNDLCFSVAGGQKVGIVGRVGAGKSTISNVLFRLLEVESGQVLIDKCNIASMGLHDVRQALMIIPQRSVVFSGTIRFNLDPFDERTDFELWEALRRAHLKEVVSRLPNGLSEELSQVSGILSVGQRQLLSLARALVRRSRILVLDEATAALDRSTDALLQKTVREEFTHCTMLIIAHRLATIIDSDRILVLEDGKAAEYDTPAKLLDREGSLFKKMVNSLGNVTAKHLTRIAKGELALKEDLDAQAALRLRSWKKVAYTLKIGKRLSMPTPVVKDTEYDEKVDKMEKVEEDAEGNDAQQERGAREKGAEKPERATDAKTATKQQAQQQQQQAQQQQQEEEEEQREWEREEDEEWDEFGGYRAQAEKGPKVLEQVQDAAQVLESVMAGEVSGEIDMELEMSGMDGDNWWNAFYDLVEGLAGKVRKLREGVNKPAPTFSAYARLGSPGLMSSFSFKTR